MPSKSGVSASKKLFILALLVIQNASQVLLMRYSTGVLREDFSKVSVVLGTEFGKFVACILVITLGIGESSLSDRSLAHKLVFLIKHSGYTWVPAFCYFIQNSLTYYASENLSSPVYAVLQQLKILSAALCSVTMLGRHLQWRQWRALFLLVLGAVLMEYHTFEIESASASDTHTLANESLLGTNRNDPIKGGLFMLVVVSLSGIAGVTTEKLLKNKDKHSQTMDSHKQLSIWDRNIQMAFWSIVVGALGLLVDPSWYSNTMRSSGSSSGSLFGFFHGWSIVTVGVVSLMTCGGLLVALTLKYTDVVIKGFASAISLILICVGGSLMLDDYLDIIFMIGACVTVLASFNYNDKESGASALLGSGSALMKEKTTPTTSSGSSSGAANNNMLSNAVRDVYLNGDMVVVTGSDDERQGFIQNQKTI